MMGSHWEGFKEGSDLVLIYMIERSLRLPCGAESVEEQGLGQGAASGIQCSMRWLSEVVGRNGL